MLFSFRMPVKPEIIKDILKDRYSKRRPAWCLLIHTMGPDIVPKNKRIFAVYQCYCVFCIVTTATHFE